MFTLFRKTDILMRRKFVSHFPAIFMDIVFNCNIDIVLNCVSASQMTEINTALCLLTKSRKLNERFPLMGIKLKTKL